MKWKTDYESSRPPFSEAGDWERMVYVIRARDVMRKMGFSDGYVDGDVLRSRSEPDIFVPLLGRRHA